MDQIIVKGARENNLKNIDLTLPKNKLIVMTGVSGSGKSSLAFDTIFAEGQRRYVESLSAYARQFLGGTNKPDVDSIEGLSPSISIDQKTTSKNPRSTVGTVTEIYDYLRLLFARVGEPYCPNHNIPIKSQTLDEIVDKIYSYGEGTKIEVLAPVVRAEKGTHKDTIDNLRKQGFTKVRINGEIRELAEDINLDKNKKSVIEVVIDRIIVKQKDRARLAEAIEQSVKMADGRVLINKVGEGETLFSENYACPICDFSLPKLEPNMFSFNNPFGACPDCNGIGVKRQINLDLLIPDKSKSIMKGAIKGLNVDANIAFTELKTVAEYYDIDLNLPISKMPKKKLDIILYGSDDEIEFNYVSNNGNTRNTYHHYEGIVTNLERRYIETNSNWIRDWLETYMMDTKCPTCHGARLKDDILAVKINKKSIYEVTEMSIKNLIIFFNNLKLTEEKRKIAELLIKEIQDRLSFLKNVGLEYLTLSRNAGTLSGGELQRIRLATQIGSHLTGVLYVLDEPSIGLHQRDNDRLINSLLEMRDLGNTLIVVEHDEDTMRASDYLVDIGPGAGLSGGYVVAEGTPEEVIKNEKSLTGKYLSGKLKIDVPDKRRKGNGKYLEVLGAKEHNLKDIDVKIPLGKFVCVTGVSGSGKSTLVDEIIYKALMKSVYNSKVDIGDHTKIKGAKNIDKVVLISQDPIGRTPRSNPATYTGLFDDIRDLFAEMKESKMRGFTKSRFSFNVKGGRCEACWGDGVKKIEMHFLPDVYVPCDVCHGKRYNSETLEVKFKGKNIHDVLEMRVEEAYEFFDSIPKIKNKLKTLMDVGLSYIKLGQSAPTLSGGEAGRVKLAKELQKKPTGKSIFILDEPTTGLHTDDIKKLLNILNQIVDHGDTVLIIEHNLDVIKVSDYIIDLGPEGGDEGGYVVAEGTPEEIIKEKRSYTGEYLKRVLNKK